MRLRMVSGDMLHAQMQLQRVLRMARHTRCITTLAPRLHRDTLHAIAVQSDELRRCELLLWNACTPAANDGVGA